MKRKSRSSMPHRKNPNKDNWRIRKSVTIDPEQDLWLASTLGEEANISEFMRALIDLARTGAVDTNKLAGLKKANSPEGNPIDRAIAYMKAKEAGLRFEEDVLTEVDTQLSKWRPKPVVEQNKVFNGGTGTNFVADVAVMNDSGEMVCSIICKSSPRPDRLELALAEALIGRQKTGKPVLVAIPYTLEESAQATERMRLMEVDLLVVGTIGKRVIELMKADKKHPHA